MKFYNLPPETLTAKFLSAKDARELAECLHISYSRMLYTIGFIRKTKENYVEFSIPKKSGGQRNISAPKKSLLYIQQRLNYILSHIYNPPKSAHGFIKKSLVESKSIISNAKQHRKRQSVLNIDIKDFFPSITGKRIFCLFTKPPFNFNKQVAGIITKICVHDLTDNLPQGAATSPIISNMICRRLDKKLTLLARDSRVVYTRYADDITFSGKKNKLNSDFILNVSNIIKEEGFLINEGKTRVHSKSQRQVVTGLVVNEKVNIQRKYIRRIRAMLHNWEIKGLSECKLLLENKYGSNADFTKILRGMIEFVGSVKGKTKEQDQNEIYIRLLNKYMYLLTGNLNLLKVENISLNSEVTGEAATRKEDVRENIDNQDASDYDLNKLLPFFE